MKGFMLGVVIGVVLSGGAMYASSDIDVSKVTGSFDVEGYAYTDSGDEICVTGSVDFTCKGGWVDTDGYGRLRRCSGDIN